MEFLQSVFTGSSYIPILLILIVLLILLLTYVVRKLPVSQKHFDELYNKIREDLKYTVSPKFIEVSTNTNELIDLSIEVWRLQQRVDKSKPNMKENQFQGFENSLNKLHRYLEKHDIEIIDYKNIRYNVGLNLDILSIEKDPTVTESMIKETVEPTIMCKGQLVRKAKVILINKA